MAEISLKKERDTELTDKITFGFWIYLMTDCVLFASLFAVYAVLRTNTFGGPTAQSTFSMPYVLTETIVLLTSSFSCGLAWLASRNRNTRQAIILYLLTFALGMSFLIMELHEFRDLVLRGSGWSRSAFLSAYFTLVGTHGLHITIGLLWMLVLMFQIWKKGLTNGLRRRLTMLTLFWHFLDVIWIFIFSIVYLMGVVR